MRNTVDLVLALQGGGAHGAFTWGVLDRLLEEAWLEFEAISATSSGAVNAVVMVQGWLDGGREGAREALNRLWDEIGRQGSLSNWGFAQSPAGSQWLLALSRHISPAQFNPLGLNPLADILSGLVDFERLRTAPIAIHVAATRVRDGALVMFGPDRLDLDAVLASTCLPNLFRAVEIDGETYWDGGYSGNPALAPLVYDAKARDLLCILVQPLERTSIPTSAREIAERMVELGFSTTFLRELEALDKNKRLIEGKLALTALGRRLQGLRLHLLEPGESLADAGAKAKLDTRPSMLGALNALGRERTQDWLDQHAEKLGRRGRGSYPAPS